MNKSSFIDEKLINELLQDNRNPDSHQIDDILIKAEAKRGLDLRDTAALLNIKKPGHLEKLYETAKKIKNDIYGNRVVIFAPLYVTNECANICEYCGFRADNTELHRRTLAKEELQEEAAILNRSGQKRLLLVYGEHPKFTPQWIAETIAAVYSIGDEQSKIRRINVNTAPMDVEGFKIIKEAAIGTYQCFQETYHRATYEKVHLKGLKADYDYRLNVHHRANQAGIDDTGLGVLFGLYDWKFELLALLQHSQDLEKIFNVGPHTVSFPRIEPALNAPLSEQPPYAVNNDELKKIIAIVRLAIPYTGIILTTREKADFRKELLEIGVSQISAGSRTYSGAYKDMIENKPDMQQFTLGDTRSLDETIRDILKQGFLPSFCTSCYRKGRTGHTFMEYAKPGDIHKFCQPNAVFTLLEYLLDYASPETKKIGLERIEQETSKCGIFNHIIKDMYKRALAGERDLML